MTSQTPIHYRLAVVGNPIAHSLSPHIHHAFAQATGISANYQKLLAPLPADEPQGFENLVQQFFANGGYGLNITVPFKEIAYALCDELSTQAQTAKAVNTLYMRNGKLIGDNTDGTGLVNAITNVGWQINNATIAILGAGGASRGVVLPLLQAGARSITVANRTHSKATALIADITDSTTLAQGKLASSSLHELTGHFDIIINATSSGLHGAHLPYHANLRCTHAYDMMYSKDGTLSSFLQHFSNTGASTADGFSMLTGQAAVSFALWTGHAPNMHDTHLQQQLNNILKGD